MKNVHLIAALALLSAQPALADSKSESHTKRTDSTGATVTTDSEHESSKTLLGARETTSETEVVRDPKGLGNKTTATTYTKERIERDGDRSRETTSTDASGTLRETSKSVETSGHLLGGGSTTTIERRAEVDPKGLGNKQVGTATEEIERRADGSVAKHTYKKEINGETVEQKTME